VLFKLHGENFFAQAMRVVNPHQPPSSRYATGFNVSQKAAGQKPV